MPPAQITTEGPAGVSFQADKANPPVTAKMLNKTAINTIFSGVLAKRLAVAEGIISNEVMINAPTNFILKAIVKAVKIISNKRKRATFKPSI